MSGGDGLIRVVDDVSAILELAEDGLGLFGEINLEADVIDDVIRLFGRIVYAAAEGDNRDHVDEGGTVLAVVDHADLTLLVGDDVFAHVGDGVLGCMDALLATVEMATWSLEKAAVTTEDFMLAVACELEEGRGGVD